MKDLDGYLRHLPDHWWRPFLLGAAAGLVAGVVAVRGSERRRDGSRRSPGGSSTEVGAGERLSRVWEDAREGLASARDRVFGEERPDLTAIDADVTGLPGSDGVRVRSLGAGIVEVVGAAADEATVERILRTVAGAEGVEVVVNRIWTPASATA